VIGCVILHTKMSPHDRFSIGLAVFIDTLTAHICYIIYFDYVCSVNLRCPHSICSQCIT